MRVLLDTNIVLDVALNRFPFAADSAAVIDLCQQGHVAAIAWHSVANIAYMLKAGARPLLADLLEFVAVAAGDTRAVREALAMRTSDLEDALQVAAALSFSADYIITRNVKDFRSLAVKALTPTEFLKLTR